MRMDKGLLLALAIVAPGAALAQEDEEANNFTVRGMGGPVAYTGDAASLTTPGAAYGVNVGLDFARFLGAELGYQGQAYRSEAPIGVPSTGIMENGGQALAKVRTDVGNFEPYAVGGLNVTRLNVADDAATAGAIQDNTLWRLPVGAGVDYQIPSGGAADVTVGVRGLYQFGLDRGAFPLATGAGAANQLMGVASVGGSW